LNYALDASAMVAYLEGEEGEVLVANLLSDPTAICYAHSINLCEVFYNANRQSGILTAKMAIKLLYTDGVIERRDMSRRFWQRVGGHKSRGRISLPDCFCLSLAEELSATAVTADRHEFERLIPLNIRPILFIR